MLLQSLQFRFHAPSKHQRRCLCLHDHHKDVQNHASCPHRVATQTQMESFNGTLALLPLSRVEGPESVELMGAERIMDHHARARQVNGLHVSNQRTMQNLCRGLNLRYCVQRRSHESHAMRRTVATVAAAKICLKSWSRDSRDDRL